MTPGIVGDAGRVEPVYGWAAVCPNGGRPIIEGSTVFARSFYVREMIGNVFRKGDETHVRGWRRAYRRGWRVIRVQISPAGEERS